MIGRRWIGLTSATVAFVGTLAPLSARPGGAIGVHGPARGVRWLGRWVNTFDLTDGCVGIATDAEMKRVADFMTVHGAHEIVIR